MRFPGLLAALSLLATTLPTGIGEAAAAPAPTVIAAYTTVAPQSVAASRLVARAVIDRSHSCPPLHVTIRGRQRTINMEVRSPASIVARNFDGVRVCSANVPVDATAASIAGTTIPAAMPRAVKRIAVLGDTGCRILNDIQDCESTTAWPLAPISTRIAAARPDLIVHVGDYIYREEKCPDPADCGSSPGPIPQSGIRDRAAVWLLDVLTPMRALFAAAPIIFVRGNHEDCSYAGNGFYLFLDPRPDSATTCAPTRSGDTLTAPSRQLPPWGVSVRVAPTRTLRLVVVDSAYGWDDAVSSYAATQRRAYVRAQAMTMDKGIDESILLVHRPIFGVTTTRFAPAGDRAWTAWVSADQTAASRGLLDHYSMIVSGHEHLAQVAKVPGQPLQAIVGNGGTWLNPSRGYADPEVPPLVTALGTSMIDGPRLPKHSKLWTRVDFGFSLLTPGASVGEWTIDMRTADGQSSMQTCRVRGLSLVRCAE